MALRVHPLVLAVAAWGLLSVVLLAVYYPSLAGDLYLDSDTYLGKNHKFQPRGSLTRALGVAASQDWHPADRRVLTNVTFALQTYNSGPGPASLRVVNIMIHAVNIVLLFFLSGALLRRAGPGLDPEGILIAATATALPWGFNPYQVEAVAYVVQRGTLLVASFTLALSLWFVSAHRRPAGHQPAWVWFLAPVLLTGAALSKETAILIPGFLLACSWLVDAGPGRRWSRRSVLLLLFIMGISILLILHVVRPLELMPGPGYADRPFTMLERVLTQPRVLAHQALLFLVPHPAWLSLKPFYSISRGPLVPVTTLLSILAMGLVLAGAWLTRRRAPLLTFAVAWFFIGHLLESTIFGLELAFPHRNYLPMAFFYLPAAALAAGKRAALPPLWRRIGAVSCLVALLLFGGLTHGHARDWNSPARFWIHNIRAAPGSLLPYIALSGHYLNTRQPDRALDVIERAFRHGSLEDDLPRREADLLANRGLARAALGSTAVGIGDLERAMAIDSRNLTYGYNRAVLLARIGRFDDALAQLARIMEADPSYPDVHLQTALTLDRAGEPKRALEYVERELAFFPDNRTARALRTHLTRKIAQQTR